ncbi:antirepressor regulating drug resistance protein [Novosphingobium profundi]|uniref:M56 family metallopeptidase n=1 Tax=Novosphingobium profundi TaxID=1774954 RepID=UPI001BD9E169|nr:M56 family metallopeptidase [Novosphingobium profundi]MBT0668438.1 antirepressor regulating drug resistance protein [Novosphingobium profundi]
MTDWLIDTFVMTGVLMTLVLLARRPVAQWFGTQAAYALWLLPFVRLVMPPLSLPRALAPTHWLSGLHVGVEQTRAAASEVAPAVTEGLAPAALSPDLAPLATTPPVSAPTAGDALATLPWTNLLMALWLGGALAFLVWRTWNYQMMRRQILRDARVVATSGRVRIVESPLAGAPLAFGVFDKVVALPLGFLASVDSESSDFAIAHELEHHAGGDLLAIMAMQPLFALHWFNPLGWAAWRAMRGDQEAACDARVVAGCERAEKARYGQLIASFAGRGQLTLGAPMAGGLSGDKPIIQRLKALRRSEVPGWRKVAGRSLFALAFVAVPMTATVSYAAFDGEPETIDGVPPVPPVPVLPTDAPSAPPAPTPPAPPAPEPNLAAAPLARLPLAAPLPPVPPVPPVPPAINGERSSAEAARARSEAARAQGEAARIRGEASRAQGEAARARGEAVRARSEAARAVAEARRAGIEGAQIEQMVQQALAHAPKVEEFTSHGGKVQTIRISQAGGEGGRAIMQEMVIDSRCAVDSPRNSSGRNGQSQVICTGAPTSTARITLAALERARASVAAHKGLEGEARAEALADIDNEIAEARKGYERD